MPNSSTLQAEFTQVLRSIARDWTSKLKEFHDLPPVGNPLNMTFNFDLITSRKQRCLRSLRYSKGRWHLYSGLHPGSGGNGILTIRGNLVDILNALNGTGPNLIFLLQAGRVIVPDARNSTQNVYLLAALCAGIPKVISHE